ncbi:MAG: LemA family protein [Planctomycetota bacterium]
MDAGTIALLIVGALAGLGIVIRNRLVRGRLRTREAWAGIEVQLKRRADLIPGLVEVVKGYARHERSTFEAVVRARAELERAQGPTASGRANGALTLGLGKLKILVEDYPELKASRHFLDLQDELADTEEKIAWARQFYNRCALAYNTRLRVFPNVLLARLFRFAPEAFFEADQDARASVRVDAAHEDG